MYVKKIKIFEGINAENVESLINDFLAKEISRGITIINMQYSNSRGVHYCMVYYTQQQEVQGK